MGVGEDERVLKKAKKLTVFRPSHPASPPLLWHERGLLGRNARKYIFLIDIFFHFLARILRVRGVLVQGAGS